MVVGCQPPDDLGTASLWKFRVGCIWLATPVVKRPMTVGSMMLDRYLCMSVSSRNRLRGVATEMYWSTGLLDLLDVYPVFAPIRRM